MEELTGDPVRNLGRLHLLSSSHDRLEIIGDRPVLHQHARALGIQAVLPDEPLPLGIRKFRKPFGDLLHPFPAHVQRRQVRFREIAIVVCLLLAPLNHGAVPGCIPPHRHLDDPAAAFERFYLSLDLVLQRLTDRPKRIQVLDFDFGSELLAADRAHGDVRLTSHCAFFHVGGADAKVPEQSPEFQQVSVGFLGGTHVRLRHDLQEWDAGAVVVHQARACHVHQLAGIFLQVSPLDADRLRLPVVPFDLHPAVFRQRKLVLADLITLREVRIHVVLPGEDRILCDLAVQGKAGQNGLFDRFPVDDRQSPRQRHTHRANMGVRLGTEDICIARAEHFRFGEQLGMNLHADDCFVFHSNLPKSVLLKFARTRSRIGGVRTACASARTWPSAPKLPRCLPWMQRRSTGRNSLPRRRKHCPEQQPLFLPPEACGRIPPRPFL